MSLPAIYEERVFDDATNDEWRTRVYVRSGELGLDRSDVELMNALKADEPRRIQIVGLAGRGRPA